jgi:hypothetical protein
MFSKILDIKENVGEILILEGYNIKESFKIMVKSLIGKTLLMWVNSIDFVVDIKQKLECMQGSLWNNNDFCLQGSNLMTII